MGKSGGEVLFEEACQYDKERIKTALKKRMRFAEESPYSPPGLVPCSKDEADSIVLRAYDDAVSTGIEALHSVRALIKILDDHGWSYSTEEYVAALKATEREKKYYIEGERQLYVVK